MRYFSLILFVLNAARLCGQQDPLYSQYFNNPMLINPAFAGSTERLYAGLAYRAQWAGVQGGPMTYNFNTHIALVNNKVGVGMMAVQDQLGDIKNTTIGTTYAYHLQLKNYTTFSFGMQTGFTRFATDPNAVSVFTSPDPAFNQFTSTQFNIGAGALLKSERFLLSLSVPRILPGTASQGGSSIKVYSQNFYAYASYLVVLSQRLEFKPSTLIRITQGTPISADFNFNFIIDRKYTAGVFARGLNTYGALVQLIMNKNYRFGYIFEVPGKSSALYFNTHEISLALSLDVLKMHNHSDTKF
jgi:type IX secretion system PorP/SprF family membrane protein